MAAALCRSAGRFGCDARCNAAVWLTESPEAVVVRKSKEPVLCDFLRSLKGQALSTCGATFAWPQRGPLVNAPSRVLPLTRAHGPDTRPTATLCRAWPFPFPSAIHLPAGYLRDSQQRPLSVSAFSGLTFASTVSSYSIVERYFILLERCVSRLIFEFFLIVRAKPGALGAPDADAEPYDGSARTARYRARSSRAWASDASDAPPESMRAISASRCAPLTQLSRVSTPASPSSRRTT